MKKIVLLSTVMIILTGCNNAAIPKPKKLIEEGVMVNILYDLSLLEAAKSRNPYSPENQSINPKQFIYKKYAIDSLQFTQSNQYYVSQIDLYKKMYEQVDRKLKAAKKQNDALLKDGNITPAAAPAVQNADTPQIQ